MTKQRTRVLLIDADMLAYRIAAGEQTEIEFQPGIFGMSCDVQTCAEKFDARIEFYLDHLKADRVVLCWSLAGDRTFRHELFPDYKAKRRSTKPVGYFAFLDHCKEKWTSREIQGLEADDLMGIMHTTRKHYRQTVVISGDKDLKTIPGRLVNLLDPDSRVQTITRKMADRWWMIQTLVGDSSDNYKGCPGVGIKKAQAALEGLDTIDDMWPVVVELFASKGLVYEDALLQARLARILRKQDWDPVYRTPLLWSPKV